jgi:uncharacterized protein YjbI with pentapeptide repeats
VQIVNRTPFVFTPLVSRFRPPGLHATLVVKGTFRLVPDGPLAPAEEQQQLAGDVYDEDDVERECLYEGDAAFWKPAADALVLATCHAPGGRAVARCRASFTVGERVRTLQVVGDRTLHRFLFLRWTSRPKAFREMPIRYRLAHGGPKSPWNPAGKGHKAGELPNLEDPAASRRPKADREEPAGFGPLSKLWKSRMQRAGTYDQAWLERHWPWFPKDFDWSYFNAAPRAQQIEGYLRGDEELRFENLHPSHPIVRTSLPGLRVRVLVDAGTSAGPSDAPMELDTLFVDVDRGLAILVWRGVVPVESEDLSDIRHLIVASEPLAEPQRPAAEYRPAPAPAEAPAPEPAAAAPAGNGAAAQFPDSEAELAQAEADAAKIEAANVEAMRKQGLEPPPPPPPPTFEEMKKQLAALPALLAASGTQLPAAAQADLAELAKGDWLKPLEAELAALEQGPAAAPRWTRERCESHVAARGSLAGEDLSGLDLSGAKLGGADLAGAVLKGTNLANADLTAAMLNGAVLEGAELAGAALRRADLRQADLTGVKASGADFAGAQMQEMEGSGAVFDGAIWTGADASRARLASASLERADLSRCVLVEADLGQASLDEAVLVAADLTGASLGGVTAPAIVMTEANLTKLKAEGADFRHGRFERVQGSGSIWDGARLESADFTSAQLARASFGGAALAEARLIGVEMPQASFEGATLTRARLRQSNLFRGSLERTELEESDLRGANLYEVEFLGARTEGARLDGANLKSTKLAAKGSA